MKLPENFPKTRLVKVSRSSATVCTRDFLTTFVTGGSLGWKTRGALMPEFENVAFELPASTTNSPKWGEAKTSEGYHIIMVEGRK